MLAEPRSRCKNCGKELTFRSSETIGPLCRLCETVEQRKEFLVPKVPKEVELFKEIMTNSDFKSSKEDGKEVQMKLCTLCQRDIPAAGPGSGVGYQHETLCGVCLKAAQRVCPHALKNEDGVTCRDCGARPWTAGRVAKGMIGFTVKAAAGTAKIFVLYTLQAILGSAVTMIAAYFVAKHLGFVP